MALKKFRGREGEKKKKGNLSRIPKYSDQFTKCTFGENAFEYMQIYSGTDWGGGGGGGVIYIYFKCFC